MYASIPRCSRAYMWSTPHMWIFWLLCILCTNHLSAQRKVYFTTVAVEKSNIQTWTQQWKEEVASAILPSVISSIVGQHRDSLLLAKGIDSSDVFSRIVSIMEVETLTEIDVGTTVYRDVAVRMDLSNPLLHSIFSKGELKPPLLVKVGTDLTIKKDTTDQAIVDSETRPQTQNPEKASLDSVVPVISDTKIVEIEQMIEEPPNYVLMKPDGWWLLTSLVIPGLGQTITDGRWWGVLVYTPAIYGVLYAGFFYSQQKKVHQNAADSFVSNTPTKLLHEQQAVQNGRLSLLGYSLGVSMYLAQLVELLFIYSNDTERYFAIKPIYDNRGMGLGLSLNL